MSSRPVVAVDCDDVLCAYKERLCEWRNEQTGSKWDLNHPKFSIMEHWGVSLDEGYKIIDDFFRSGEVEKLEVISGAVEALGVLSKFCDLYVVTSRQAWSEELTKEWVFKHFGRDLFKGFLFGNAFVKDSPGRPKSDLCREIGANFLIDDQIHHLLNVKKEANVKNPILFNWASRHPWAVLPTEGDSAQYEGIKVCTSWDEVVVEILRVIEESAE